MCKVKVFDSMLVYASSLTFICRMTTFGIVFTFKSNPQVEDVCKGRICASMVLYSLYFDMNQDNFGDFFTFDPTSRVQGECKDIICAYMLLHS